jgi:hypothetical protein
MKQETAARIWQAYREIETATELLEELNKLKEEFEFDKNAPTLRDGFGRRKHFQMGIPSGENSHRLFDVSPPLAESVIRAHIKNKEAELAEAKEQARIELSV